MNRHIGNANVAMNGRTKSNVWSEKNGHALFVVEITMLLLLTKRMDTPALIAMTENYLKDSIRLVKGIRNYYQNYMRLETLSWEDLLSKCLVTQLLS
ncbi:hypothetical protein SAMN05216356_12053 [Oribacterium sp. WCC10]|nr:hypothetical protein SAMN05216356_12053 [Oribacterium sp. WCC10]